MANTQLVLPTVITASFTVETVIATIPNVLLNAPFGPGGDNPQGFVLDGTVNFGIASGTTSISVALRKGGTGTNGVLVDSAIWTTAVADTIAGNLPFSLDLFDPNPPTTNGANYPGQGGAVTLPQQVGVEGVMETGITYFLTASATGAAVTVGTTAAMTGSVANPGRIQANLVTTFQ